MAAAIPGCRRQRTARSIPCLLSRTRARGCPTPQCLTAAVARTRACTFRRPRFHSKAAKWLLLLHRWPPHILAATTVSLSRPTTLHVADIRSNLLFLPATAGTACRPTAGSQMCLFRLVIRSCQPSLIKVRNNPALHVSEITCIGPHDRAVVLLKHLSPSQALVFCSAIFVGVKMLAIRAEMIAMPSKASPSSQNLQSVVPQFYHMFCCV